MFNRLAVRGDDASPLYKGLAAAAGEAPGWNFHKYLVDRQGRVTGSFASGVTPDDKRLLAAIERAL
jgi:glutathione peroxidase